jgi:phosphomannomutase
MDLKRDEILLLFDIDKTLTPPRSSIEPEFERFLFEKIKQRATIGIITGANIEKIYEQLDGPKILQIYDYIFPENGLVQIVNGVETGKQSLQQHLGEETIHRFVSFLMAQTDYMTRGFYTGSSASLSGTLPI